MKKVIWTYGLIAGGIVGAMLLISLVFYNNGTLNFDNGEVVGYTTMVIALSMIFFGIKAYRDNYQNGVISFGKGFKIGILITLIASLMYVLAWEIGYQTIASDFIEKYSEYVITKMKTDGATEAQLQEAREANASFGEVYRNPVVRFGFTFLEISWVGLVITLVCAAILRKKEVLPTHETVTRGR